MNAYQWIKQKVKDLLEPPEIRAQIEQTHAEFEEARKLLQEKIDDTTNEVTRVGAVRNEH